MEFDDDELLVIVGDEDAAATVRELTGAAMVHVASPRVFVINDPAGVHTNELAGVPRLTAIRGGSIAPEVLDELDENEALFVQAWTLRKSESKTRRGDGLDWDSEGFEPPDASPDLAHDD